VVGIRMYILFKK